MAGSEIQEPYSLTFQANSIHSGSISFGRFEKEGLSWEKRSSFSHNKYLEEVDKCSKPGSVTEMKAHFEAHFKKKGIRFPDSLESQTWGVRHQTCEPEAVYAAESFEYDRSDGSFSSQSDSPCNEQVKHDEENDHCVSSYDEIVVNSDDVIELNEEVGVYHETLAVPLDNDEVSMELFAIKEDRCEESSKEDHKLSEIPLEIEFRDGDEDSDARGSKLDQDVPTKPSVSGVKSLANIPHAVSVTKATTKRHDLTPKAVSRRTTPSNKTNVDTKSQKQLRPKKPVEPKPPTLKKTEIRTPLDTNRCKTGTYSSKLEISTSASSFRFKSSERAEKRKEFYVKLEEKMYAKKTETNQVQAKTQEKAKAEIKQFRKSLNFKATPMPTFYNTSTKPESHSKSEPSKVAPSRPRPATSASITKRAITSVGLRKQSVTKDSNLQKGNVTIVETKKKIVTRRSGN